MLLRQHSQASLQNSRSATPKKLLLLPQLLLLLLLQKAWVVAAAVLPYLPSLPIYLFLNVSSYFPAERRTKISRPNGILTEFLHFWLQ